MGLELEQDERQRLDALSKWAKRVLDEGSVHAGAEDRRANRFSRNAELSMIPLDNQTLRPDLGNRVAVISRDISEFGVGVLSNRPLDADLYFVEFADEAGVYLLRKARERCVRGSIREYGFMILDRYDSFQHLRET